MSRLILAPMEGLADDILRAVLTSTGAYDWCVTEFVRVSDTVLPLSSFTRLSPEMKQGAKTPNGTPVRLQLLGSDPEMMARNAARAARLRPFGIDLNFGCPAPLVNRHRGGAALLEEPELLSAIIRAVRSAVPADIPVTAKMRLGIDSTDFAVECAQALAEGGAAELVVHGRTKQDGYRPPARWEWIRHVREAISIPVIANGEVWNVADYHAIRAATGCSDVMIGRGAVADPLLTRRIRDDLKGIKALNPAQDWETVRSLLATFWPRVLGKVAAKHAPGRLKQWLNMLRRHYPAAEALFNALREARQLEEINDCLNRNGIEWPRQAD